MRLIPGLTVRDVAQFKVNFYRAVCAPLLAHDCISQPGDVIPDVVVGTHQSCAEQLFQWGLMHCTAVDISSQLLDLGRQTRHDRTERFLVPSFSEHLQVYAD